MATVIMPNPEMTIDKAGLAATSRFSKGMKVVDEPTIRQEEQYARRTFQYGLPAKR
jgi:hypothetical protein